MFGHKVGVHPCADKFKLNTQVKFHIRAYCVASGTLRVYLYDRLLALFASMPYEAPTTVKAAVNLQQHLTNTCLQTNPHENVVKLLDELEGSSVLHGSDILTASDIESVVSQITEILGEVFRAALENPIHFQVLSPRDMPHCN
jgi:tubulin---tyrosine ligase